MALGVPILKHFRVYCAIVLKVILHKRRLIKQRKKAQANAKETRLHRPEISVNLDADSIRVRQPSSDIQNTRKLILMLAIVTILFLVGYIPVFAVLLWRQSVDKHQIECLSGTDLVAYDLATTSFLISSAVNPWVYGIMCSQFRQYFLERFRGIFLILIDICRNR